MLEKILLEAIGEDKTFPERESDEYDAGYQQCQKDMRAKIPQVIEEFAGFIIDKFGSMDGNTFKLGKTEIEIIKSLTENNHDSTS